MEDGIWFLNSGTTCQRTSKQCLQYSQRKMFSTQNFIFTQTINQMWQQNKHFHNVRIQKNHQVSFVRKLFLHLLQQVERKKTMKEKTMGSKKWWSSQGQVCKWPKLQQDSTSHQGECIQKKKKDSSEYLIFKKKKKKRKKKAAGAYGREIQCRKKIKSIKRKIKHLVNRMVPQKCLHPPWNL